MTQTITGVVVAVALVMGGFAMALPAQADALSYVAPTYNNYYPVSQHQYYGNYTVPYYQNQYYNYNYSNVSTQSSYWHYNTYPEVPYQVYYGYQPYHYEYPQYYYTYSDYDYGYYDHNYNNSYYYDDYYRYSYNDNWYNNRRNHGHNYDSQCGYDANGMQWCY